MLMRFSNIEWDVDCREDLKTLPSEVVLEVEDDFDADEDGADLLSDNFGYCVKGFDCDPA